MSMINISELHPSNRTTDKWTKYNALLFSMHVCSGGTNINDMNIGSKNTYAHKYM